jgi:PEP-CTERM motif-containing protein
MSNCKNRWLMKGGFLIALGLIANLARAEYDSADTRTPSPTYSSHDEVVFGPGYRIGSFFDVFADFQRLPPPAPNSTRIDSFFDVFTEIDLAPPGGAFQHYQAHAQMSMRLNGLPPGTPYFDTEMLQLDLTGGTLPGGVMIRESPTRASTGRTTQTPVGGGVYHIDSFFDVFTELSIDGGQNWMPSTSSNNGAMHLSGNLPEPASASLSLLGAVALAGFGLRRRNH